MKKVYALFRGEYSDTELIKIFASEAKAQAIIDKEWEEFYKDYLASFEIFKQNEEQTSYTYHYSLYFKEIGRSKIERKTPATLKYIKEHFNYYVGMSISECDFDDCPDFLVDKIE